MSKTHGSFQDEPGKSVGTLDGKAGGELEKDPTAGESDYDTDYSGGSDYSGGGSGGSGDSGGSDYSGDSGTDGSGTDDTNSGGADDGADDQPPDDETLHVDDESDDDSSDDGSGDDSSDDDSGDDGSSDIGTGEADRGELDHDGGTNEYTPPENTVSIDIEAMTRLVAAMERASDRVTVVQDELRRILLGVRVDTSDTTRFDQVAAWIDDELPGLRRRLALAQDLEGDTPRRSPDARVPVVRIPYVGDENLVPDYPPKQSYQNGQEAAERFAVPHDQKPATREIIADLRTGRHDPYFAKEFVHKTQPDEVVRVVLQATSGEGDDAADHDDLVHLTASTVATGSRGTGELAPPEGYEAQWEALRGSDDPQTAALAARLRPAPGAPE